MSQGTLVEDIKSMSHSDQWIEFREQIGRLPIESQIYCRKIASRRIEERLAGTGQGISSSDVNHIMFSIWLHEADGDMSKFISVSAKDWWRSWGSSI